MPLALDREPRPRRAISLAMSLDSLRARIDSIDDRILELLEQRAAVAEEVAREKRAAAAAPKFHDPERERRVIERLYAKGAGRFPRDAIRTVFREVMSACLSLEEPLRVSYLGPEGTFTQLAARRLFGLAARYREASTIDGVFDAVRAKDAAYGVVPLENSTEGSVTRTTDALLEGDLVIRQELVLEVSQCLLSRVESLPAVARVYSHPQALAQCRVWLAKNLPHAQLVETPSTAAAAREAMGDEAGAAIGGALGSEIYGIPILREKIQDHAENATRFVVLATEDAPRSGNDRTTVGFSVHDGRGALRKVLSVFEDAGVNLTRIESRPSRKAQWEYVFLADLEGHRTDPEVATAIANVSAMCPFVKVLGSYPRG
jgi:chorismate mutase/prephenate dehydratase